jgi:hypothetical protein
MGESAADGIGVAGVRAGVGPHYCTLHGPFDGPFDGPIHGPHYWNVDR